MKLVAGTRDAILGAVMFDMWEVHGQSFTDGTGVSCNRKRRIARV